MLAVLFFLVVVAVVSVVGFAIYVEASHEKTKAHLGVTSAEYAEFMALYQAGFDVTDLRDEYLARKEASE